MARTNPETEIQKAIRDLFRISPAVDWAMRANAGVLRLAGGRTVRMAEKGTSDLVGMLANGRAFFFEVKQPGEIPTDIQREFLTARAVQNGKAGWGCSIEDAQNFLHARHDGRVWEP